MRRVLAIFFLALLPITVYADNGDASEGGNGGGPFSYSCGAGAILRGFYARAGSWVDAITPVCVVESGRYAGEVVRRPEPTFGGTGGVPLSIHCGGGQPIVEMKVTSGMLTDHIRGITALQLVCANGGINGKINVQSREIGGPDKPKTHRTELACNAGSIVRGITGRSGKWLDQIGIVCGPPPAP